MSLADELLNDLDGLSDDGGPSETEEPIAGPSSLPSNGKRRRDSNDDGEDEDDEPVSPVLASAVDQPTFESQLSGGMGELRLEDGSTRYIGGTSHLIYLGQHNNNETASSPDPYADEQQYQQVDQDPFCSWTTVTSDPELVQHLISMYFCWHYSFFTTLPKNLFMQEFKARYTAAGGRCASTCAAGWSCFPAGLASTSREPTWSSASRAVTTS